MSQSFDNARKMAAEGHYEYAIDLYLDGLREDPDNLAAHQAMREVALERKSNGGSDLPMLQKVKLRKPTGDAVGDLLNIEKLLAYDPFNRDWLIAAANHARSANLEATTTWFLQLCQQGGS